MALYSSETSHIKDESRVEASLRLTCCEFGGNTTLTIPLLGSRSPQGLIHTPLRTPLDLDRPTSDIERAMLYWLPRAMLYWLPRAISTATIIVSSWTMVEESEQTLPLSQQAGKANSLHQCQG